MIVASGRRTLPLEHSWPLNDQSKQFELGLVLNSAITDALLPERIGHLSTHHAGCWECDLTDNSLIWSGGVYDLFGLPRGMKISRDHVVALYSEKSRATMESLRAYSIKHRRGFTIDIEIAPIVGGTRGMRLIAAPVVQNGKVVKLHGLKLAL
jgi:hypothetical protein